MNKDFKIIKQSDISAFENGIVRIKELFSTDNISFTIVELNGKNKKNRQLVSDAWYFVVKGSGIFIINNEECAVSEGDLVFIPKLTDYSDEGEMTLLAVLSPKFNPDTVLQID
jgi:mannose-6-phosphate isomerase-like protein (cupin superfamily)